MVASASQGSASGTVRGARLHSGAVTCGPASPMRLAQAAQASRRAAVQLEAPVPLATPATTARLAASAISPTGTCGSSRCRTRMNGTPSRAADPAASARIVSGRRSPRSGRPGSSPALLMTCTPGAPVARSHVAIVGSARKVPPSGP